MQAPSLLTEIFGENIPQGFIERDLETVHEISIPWETPQIDLLNESAGVEKKLSGFFTSNFGPGYCADGGERMLYHFLK